MPQTGSWSSKERTYAKTSHTEDPLASSQPTQEKAEKAKVPTPGEDKLQQLWTGSALLLKGSSLLWRQLVAMAGKLDSETHLSPASQLICTKCLHCQLNSGKATHKECLHWKLIPEVHPGPFGGKPRAVLDETGGKQVTPQSWRHQRAYKLLVPNQWCFLQSRKLTQKRSGSRMVGLFGWCYLIIL